MNIRKPKPFNFITPEDYFKSIIDNVDRVATHATTHKKYFYSTSLGYICFEYNRYYGEMWINTKIWNKLQNRYGLEFRDICQIIKPILEQHYHIQLNGIGYCAEGYLIILKRELAL